MIVRPKNLFLLLLFGCYVLIGICSYGKYGVSWDEPTSYTNGLVNLKYIETLVAPGQLTPELKAMPDLKVWQDRDYGVAFELPVAALTQALDIKDEQVYRFRHLLTFLFFTLGVLAVYKTATFVYGDYRAGLLAALMLVLSPRIFGESFYNSKDLVFVAAMAIATYTMTRLLVRPRWTWALVHGLACGFAIDIRAMGIVMVAVTCGFLLVRACKREISVRACMINVALYLCVTVLVVIALFPFLWENPVGNFVYVLAHMAKFRWSGTVLYMGSVLKATHLPWHYIPVWMFLTTPPLFFLLMVAGMVRLGFVVLRNRFALWADASQMSELSYAVLFAGPVLAIMAIHAVLYDGWRHLYFVYPAFILVATGGAVACWRRAAGVRWARAALVTCLALVFAANAWWMIRAYPIQNVYFNVFAGKSWKDRFDVDYWGLANREALQYVLDHTDDSTFTIRAMSATPLDVAMLAFPPSERQRIILAASAKRPQYLLTNYRSARTFPLKDFLPDYSVFYEKRVGKELIVSVFKIRDPGAALTVSRVSRSYTPQEVSHLSFGLDKPYTRAGKTYVDLKITNSGPLRLASTSTVDTPLRLSWRFLDSHGVPTSGWDTRLDLPSDIPARGSLVVSLPIDPKMEVPGGTMQADLVQERVFWGHDIGLIPASMPWPRDRVAP